MDQETLDHLNRGYNILTGVISTLSLEASTTRITRSVELAEAMEKTAAKIREGLDEVQAGVKELTGLKYMVVITTNTSSAMYVRKMRGRQNLAIVDQLFRGDTFIKEFDDLTEAEKFADQLEF